MDDKNKDLPLVVSEILIEMQQMRQEMREGNDRVVDTMSKLIGTLTEHLIDTRDTVKTFGQRRAESHRVC